MRRTAPRALALALAISSAGLLRAATDPDEGGALTPTGNAQFAFSWWARAGVYYLVEVSDDLVNWRYEGTLFLGCDGVAPPVCLRPTGSRMFVRLNFDPFHSDADGDGISDAWEVLHGLNNRANDAGDDPDADQLSNLEEQGLGTNPKLAAAAGAAAAGLGLVLHTDLD